MAQEEADHRGDEASDVELGHVGHPEVAAFLRMAIDARLASPNEVVRWADSIVIHDECPPDWAVDLSVSRTWPIQRLSDALGIVAQGARAEAARLMLAGRLARKLSRKEISIQQVLEVIWQLPLRRFENLETDPLSQAVYEIDHAHELVTEGLATLEEVAEEVDHALSPFARFDWSAA